MLLETIVYSTLLSTLFVYLYFAQEKAYNERHLEEATSPVEEEALTFVPEEEETDWSDQVEAWHTYEAAKEKVYYLAEQLKASHTIRELKALASKAGIKGYGDMKKEQLALAIAAL